MASEPSFYGYMCIFFLYFILLFKKEKKKYIANVLFQLFFLAQSSVGLVYLIVIVLFYLLEKVKKISMKDTCVYAAGIMEVFILLKKWVFANRATRMGSLLFYIFTNGIKGIFTLVQKDASIAIRLNAILISIKEFIRYYGMPHGYLGEARFQSGYGAMLYELGIIGFIMIVVIWHVVYRGYYEHAMLAAGSLTIIMFSAVQVSLPTFGFLIGVCLYNAERVDYGKFLK